MNVFELVRISVQQPSYKITPHSTHFRSCRRRRGDWGISQDCSRSQRWG